MTNLRRNCCGYRKLVAAKFDGSKQRRSPGRLRISSEIEDLVIRLARENSGWGYDRIVGALVNLGHQVSDQTVGNILRRHGIEPVPERSKTTTWQEFIRRHARIFSFRKSTVAFVTGFSRDELMALAGRYRTMFDLQAQRFNVPDDEEGTTYDVLS